MDPSENKRPEIAVILIFLIIITAFIFRGALWSLATGNVHYFVPVEDKIYLSGNSSDLTDYWAKITKEAGFEESSAAIESFSLHKNPDGTIESLFMFFYALKNGKDYRYSVSYNAGEASGQNRITIYSREGKPPMPKFTTRQSYSPADFLRETEKINLTDLGCQNNTVSIRADSNHGGGSYVSGNYRIFLQENDTLIPLERISLNNDCLTPFPIMISLMHCSEFSKGTSCSSFENLVIFPEKCTAGAEISYLT
ncbi:hypothetical protein F1737_09370 [Methanoplanus sp. FWC-SCC4]|uniref:Uncharacterized protein n=1 Tax=Methanochimaera problematica TaxID=2609417 RepID=A0AA97FCG9_9EURY|nr:hypothetical protein [Methanoplanus sp. FWC-SCC4]WOF16880.1 hypothetical protein F1737_09370 [Methanoplanus sp. FWC-SCC4]